MHIRNKICSKEMVNKLSKTIVKIKGNATSRKSRSAIRDIVEMCEHFVELKEILKTAKAK
jgi:hypothetical protein